MVLGSLCLSWRLPRGGDMQPSTTNVTSTSGAECTLRLPPICDTAVAHTLKNDLMRLTTPGGILVVLAQDVQLITTACMQLLLAADRALARHGGALQLREASAAARTAFDDLGLNADFNRWIDAHG